MSNPKRIAIFCDGTWNQPDQRDQGKVQPTNVVKLYDAVAQGNVDDTEQLAFYQKGVGTDGLVSQVLGGAFGYGLSSNVKRAYRLLSDNFDPGDEIFLFGFSRGAYTARSLAGLIRNCGVLRREHSPRVSNAYHLYRKRGDGAHPNSKIAIDFRRKYSHESRVKFIGVWDTVGSLGIPLSWRNPFPCVVHMLSKHWQFHDVTLSSYVDNAFHALAIDEVRKSFTPTIWEQDEKDVHQTLEQQWFPGVHSNVGGGYADTGLSDIAHLWMQEKAAECGLVFTPPAANDRPQPDPGGVLRDPRSFLYRLLAQFIGTHVRPVAAERRDKKTGQLLKTAEGVDESANERMDLLLQPPYRPKNLLAFLERKQNHPPG